MEDGVWRTIRGRRIFIRSGESLGSAMSRSGKFKRADIREGRKELSGIDRANKNRNIAKTNMNTESKIRKIEKNEHKYTKHELRDNDFKNQDRKHLINEKEDTINRGARRVDRNAMRYSKQDERELRHEELQKKLADYKAKKQSNNKVEAEKELYERAKNNPDSIDPMTENSTDWEALEKKYGKQEETIKNYVEKKKSNNKVATEIKDNKAIRNENAQLKKYNEYNKNEEQYREKISREIAKELNASLKNASENRLQKEAGNIRSYVDGEVLEKGEKPYSNIYGGLERSTKSLEKWLKRLRKGK